MSGAALGAGLQHLGWIDLPEHRGPGGFDHAMVDRPRGLLFVAHTANDAVDAIDLRSGRFRFSVEGLAGVAGALVDESTGRVFTSNRGEDTVAFVEPDGRLTKTAVGAGPNGLAFDPASGLLLCAGVGNAKLEAPPSVTLLDAGTGAALGTFPMPGRTRWAIFDPDQQVFFVNVADPPQIVVIEPGPPVRLTRRIPVPARGPHGLDLDRARARLACACDQGTLLSIDARSGAVAGELPLSGAPDVLFLNPTLSRLYVAIGDPGVVDVVDVERWERVAVLTTERGAHTLAIDESTNRIYVFLPGSHRASVFQDGA